MEVRPGQLRNALFPIEVKLAGRVMELVRRKQPSNAPSPIEVNAEFSGMVMEVRL